MKLSRLITIPVAIVLIALAVANRRLVPVSFDPFSSEAPAVFIPLPLWAIVFGAFFAGFLAGGLTSWVTRLHRHVRRALSRRRIARAARRAVKVGENDPLSDLPAIAHRPENLPAPRRWLPGRKNPPSRAA